MANAATAGQTRVPVCGFRDGVLSTSTPQSEMRIRWRPRPLGPPPIPGTPDIVPITSGVELVLEGKVQRHCVATYERAVRAGQVYCYQVLRPERATLMIRQGADGGWHVAELRGKANSPVGPATRALVDAWLARYRIAP